MNVSKGKKIHKELGEKIKTRRMEKNMKIIEVSRITGLTSSMISQVERSLISPSIDTLRKISEAIDIPISYFFEDSNEDVKADEGKVEEVKQEYTQNVVIERSPVVKMHQRKVLSPGPGVTFYLLNPGYERADRVYL